MEKTERVSLCVCRCLLVCDSLRAVVRLNGLAEPYCWTGTAGQRRTKREHSDSAVPDMTDDPPTLCTCARWKEQNNNTKEHWVTNSNIHLLHLLGTDYNRNCTNVAKCLCLYDWTLAGTDADRWPTRGWSAAMCAPCTQTVFSTARGFKHSQAKCNRHDSPPRHSSPSTMPFQESLSAAGLEG